MNSNEISVRVLRGAEANFTAEAKYIQNFAFAGICRVVKLGQIVFFSTPSGDAWMLDPEDRFAVCLARDGQSLPIPIQETDTNLLIEWNADYRIEGEAFAVVERSGDAARTILGYPTAEIERMVREYPTAPPEDLAAVEAARARLKIGRNDPCPCDSGKKYKKCCQPNDETAVRQPSAARQSRETQRVETQRPLRDNTGAETERPETDAEVADEPDKTGETAIPPAVPTELDELWDGFEALEHPTTAEMDAFLAELLAQPLESTSWNEVLHAFARRQHSDLPRVFHRIAAVVPHTKATGLSHFYWAAAEEFIRRGMNHLLPEVAAGFRRLDLDSYDPDALTHLEDWLLVAGCEDEALQLAEHFLPIERTDDGLMPYAVPQRCSRIFELRVGQALRAGQAGEQSPDRIAEHLRRDIEDEIHADAARMAAEIASGQAPTHSWTREEFDLVTGDPSADESAWRACLRLRGALMRVAREAWQLETQPPGRVLWSLDLLLGSVDGRKQRKKPKKTRDNLLDYLRPAGLEERIARSCPELFGVNGARACVLVQAFSLLTRSAARHELISTAEAASMEKELSRLKEELDRGK